MAGGSTTHKVLSLTVTDADAPVVRKKPKAKTASPKKQAVKKATPKKVAKKKAPKKAKLARTSKVSAGGKKTKAVKATKKTPAKKKVAVKKEPASTASPISKTELLQTVRKEPLGHLLVEHILNDAGFRGTVSSDKNLLDQYATDESIFYVRPQIVIQPKNQKDVEIAVSVLGKETGRFPSLSLTPRAAGTGLGGGSLTDSIVIDVSRHMHSVVDVKEHKGKVTFTCEPGAMWRDVEKKLKAHDAYLPPYPASKDICSIGGSVGNNAAGPDSLRYGHVADWVESLNVTLHDGNTHTIKPLNWKEYRALIKKKNAHAEIAKKVFALIEKNEKEIEKAKPKTKKNSAGYALWDALDVPVKDFKKGKGFFDLTRLISGSQGTIGIITSITMRAEKIAHDTSLLVVPVFDLQTAGNIVTEAIKHDPINVEVFDALTFDLAMKNPDFFKDRLGNMEYYRALLSMYTMYHVRYARKIPEFTLLITLDNAELTHKKRKEILTALRSHGGKKARVVHSTAEKDMLWQIRRASYTLSKLKDTTKRPAAFLEDMTVPPKNLAKFFTEIKKLLKKYNVTAAVHGHGGNGHFHFYPLLDFTSKSTPALIEKMAEEFFDVAIKHDGNICGEHNDGIIRTPHLHKMFNRKTLQLFKDVENIFDPHDIFNPGKKVNPRFDIKESVRRTN